MAASPWASLKDRKGARIAKREAVLSTAARFFVEKGFHATSLDEVAEALHITKPTLYYYIKSKDDILFECVRLGLERVKAAIETAAAGNGSAIDKLRAALNSYVHIVTEDYGQCLIRVGEDPLPPEKKVVLRRQKAEIDKEFRVLVEQGIAEGALAPMDPKIATFIVMGAISWIGRWFKPDGELTPDEVAEHCIAILMSGMAARGPAGG